MRKYSLLIIFAILIAFSCKNDDSEPLTLIYDQFYDVNISPEITNFKAEIEQEIEYIEQFKDNSTLENLTLLQNQWLVTAKSYAKASAYNYVALKQKFYYLSIYNSPINTSVIEANISEEITYDISYLSTKSTTTKGLGTLEYLLYHEQNTSEALNLLQQNKYRVDYLLGVANEILRQTNLLIDFWENDYKTTFANSNGETCTTNARCLAFNQLINILDVIKVTKIGKPAGLEKSDNTAPNLLEAFRSENSLALIKASIQEVEHVYSLSTVNFANIIDDIDDTNKLSNLIATNFTEVYKSIDAIETNLFTAITEEPKKVEDLYNAIGDLTIKFSVDGASLLSVTVLPTDNDGD